jgi:hypothetical protein
MIPMDGEMRRAVIIKEQSMNERYPPTIEVGSNDYFKQKWSIVKGWTSCVTMTSDSHSDCPILDESNFNIALGIIRCELSKIREVLPYASPSEIESVYENHWAVLSHHPWTGGWLKTLAVSPEFSYAATKINEELKSYSILDEMHYSELQEQYAEESYCTRNDDGTWTHNYGFTSDPDNWEIWSEDTFV